MRRRAAASSKACWSWLGSGLFSSWLLLISASGSSSEDEDSVACFVTPPCFDKCTGTGMADGDICGGAELAPGRDVTARNLAGGCGGLMGESGGFWTAGDILFGVAAGSAIG